MTKRKIAGYVFLVFALFLWALFGLLKYDAHVSNNIANQPHGPADLNGLAGVAGLGITVLSIFVLFIAVVFSATAIILFKSSSNRK
ncbi:MAG: hypothetical protein ACHQT9_03355 [Candidatus Saccharimonadales bacterium]